MLINCLYLAWALYNLYFIDGLLESNSDNKLIA